MTNYKRILIAGRGGAEVIKILDEVVPEPGPNQALVKILAAGVGYADLMAQHGGYPLAPRLPFTPGYDLAGIVEKIGPGTVGITEGQYVAALNPNFGCYAEYAIVPAELLVPFPSHLDPAEVVSLVLNYLTADCILNKKANVKPHDTVLIHSAAGGVGTALLQLGRLKNLTMFGTASQKKHAAIQALGAIPIDYKREDFVEVVRKAIPAGVDSAFDPIGGAHLRRSYDSVRNGGNVVSYGFAGDNLGGLLPMIKGVMQMGYLNLLPNGKRVRLCATPSEVKNNGDWYRATLVELIRMLASRQISPVIGARVALPEAARALSMLERGTVSGKIILVSGQSA